MSQNISFFLRKQKGKSLLTIFPHADDAPFVAGGFFQLLERHGVKTKLICLTSDSDENELKDSCRELGIDDFKIYDFKSGELKKSKKKWLNKLEEDINSTKPFAVLAFDPNGVTGHIDHTISSIAIFNMLGSMKGTRPKLLWRVSDEQEKRYFNSTNEKRLDVKPSFHYFLKVLESTKKLRAIFKHKSKLKSFMFKLRLIEWYLLDHKELYYLVDYGNNKYQIAVS